ncbi:MAG: N-6 DNA methylase [Flavobacteriaceae bacterium]|nr:N-6 DNA methylase [Flavobacteriaceae bacterium]
MALYQTSVLKNYLKRQDEVIVNKAYKKYVKYFHNSTIQENIKKSKEEEYQGIFLTELFVNILGYTLNPMPNFNLVAEKKNQSNSQKADGAILKDKLAVAVIELKGTKTKDLESIRKQAFDYKANQKGCVFVITSNYEKLRFYINDATEFEEFNLFTLTNKEFELLYLCLNKENILGNLPLKIKEESVTEEEKITKSFYADYSMFKRELYRDLVKQNGKDLKLIRHSELGSESHTSDQKELQQLEKNAKLTLFKKSQKLIDRFLFIFFAEDRDLLPPNSTVQILDKWKSDMEFGDERPLYNLFKQYFNYLDSGRKQMGKRAEIYAYNGGLFKPDIVLDSVKINDELLYKHTKALAKYDFESQVDVNILGHIFENSLNEIESVNAEIEGSDFDKQKSKRKKDGVFYTPKYITKYIVENTIGKLCIEKKEELGFKEEEYYKSRKGRQQATLENLIAILDSYRAWLLKLTICDPACGSGAFLNQALDFLIKEHRYIDELKAKLLGGGLVLSDIENTILENNIYGVDLNEESVEIAKLSLWLRTAQPKRKLNDLSSNIKCGNSLIDSKAVAGDKAFNWQQEFPHIFNNGGFDVVIGNPPYGAGFSQEEIVYYNNAYKFQNYQLDSYLIFTEKLKKLIRKNGFGSYIMPNTWLSSLFAEKIRNFVLTNFSIIEINHYSYFVFADATVETDTYIFRNNDNFSKNEIQINIIDKNGKIISKQINQQDLICKNGKPINIFEMREYESIKLKLHRADKLGALTQIVQGTKPFQKGKGIPKQDENTLINQPFVKNYKVDENFRPLLRGSLMNRYQTLWNNDYWISYGDWLAEPRYSAKFDSDEKLLIRQTGDSLIATYDNNKFIARDNL